MNEMKQNHFRIYRFGGLDETYVAFWIISESAANAAYERNGILVSVDRSNSESRITSGAPPISDTLDSTVVGKCIVRIHADTVAVFIREHRVSTRWRRVAGTRIASQDGTRRFVSDKPVVYTLRSDAWLR